MDVSVIISKSRIQTGTTVGQKSDALMLADLNIVQSDIFSRLSVTSKKYAWNEYKPTTTVVDQSEYSVPRATVSDTGLKRVLKVEVKYTSTGDYVKAKLQDTTTFDEDNYTNKNAPYAIQRDGSIFIYPAPDVAVTNGLKISGQYLPLDLASDTESADIKLGVENHDVLLAGLNMWNYADKQLFEKEGLARQKYEIGVLRIITEGGADIEDGYETTETDVYNVGQTFLP